MVLTTEQALHNENARLQALVTSLTERVAAQSELLSRRAEGDETAAVVEALRQLVYVDDEHCRYDHNDFCQSHYSGRPCRMETAREALARYDAKVNEGGEAR